MAKKKERNISWRKHWPNEFKTGRLSYEKPLTQWAYIMVIDEMFELQKRNECLLYKHAIKRYGKKEVDKLIEESLIEKRDSNFNNEECLFCDQIDNNIEEYDATSKQKREAINVRWHGNKEGKKKANKYENNDPYLKIQPEVQALLDKGKEDENKEVTYDPDNLPF